MLVELALPKAFSLREENEFYPLIHLMSKINHGLMVAQVATGMHVNGGCTVLWGLVYQEDQVLTRADVLAALEEAGFDATHGVIGDLSFCAMQPAEAVVA